MPQLLDGLVKRDITMLEERVGAAAAVLLVAFISHSELILLRLLFVFMSVCVCLPSGWASR